MEKVTKKKPIGAVPGINSLKTTTVMLILLISFNINAFSKPGNKQSKEKAIDIYLNAMVHSSTDPIINDIIERDAEFNVTLRNNVSKVIKAVMLHYLKNVQNIEQNCKSSSSVMHD